MSLWIMPSFILMLIFRNSLSKEVMAALFPYSPELNPIEQFWSACESKLEKLLKKETWTTRIGEACNNIYMSDLQRFCRYSESKFQGCLDEKPL